MPSRTAHLPLVTICPLASGKMKWPNGGSIHGSTGSAGDLAWGIALQLQQLDLDVELELEHSGSSRAVDAAPFLARLLPAPYSGISALVIKEVSAPVRLHGPIYVGYQRWPFWALLCHTHASGSTYLTLMHGAKPQR